MLAEGKLFAWYDVRMVCDSWLIWSKYTEANLCSLCIYKALRRDGHSGHVDGHELDIA